VWFLYIILVGIGQKNGGKGDTGKRGDTLVFRLRIVIFFFLPAMHLWFSRKDEGPCGG
jgi:hypothetical protein